MKSFTLIQLHLRSRGSPVHHCGWFDCPVVEICMKGVTQTTYGLNMIMTEEWILANQLYFWSSSSNFRQQRWAEQLCVLGDEHQGCLRGPKRLQKNGSGFTVHTALTVLQRNICMEICWVFGNTSSWACFDRSVNRMYDWSPVVVFPISLVSQHVVLSLLPNLFRSAPSARWSSPSALETQVNNKQQDEGPLFDESICYWFLSWRPPLFPPPLQQQCNSVKENVANREGWLRETRGRMSNKRFILPGQRCGNGVGMSVQGQSIDTDRQSKQSPLWVNAASGWQLKDIQPAQEVNTARVRRSGVRVTSPALLFSFRQWNKPVPMPEANHATLGKKIPVLC